MKADQIITDNIAYHLRAGARGTTSIDRMAVVLDTERWRAVRTRARSRITHYEPCPDARSSGGDVGVLVVEVEPFHVAEAERANPTDILDIAEKAMVEIKAKRLPDLPPWYSINTVLLREIIQPWTEYLREQLRDDRRRRAARGDQDAADALEKEARERIISVVGNLAPREHDDWVGLEEMLESYHRHRQRAHRA